MAYGAEIHDTGFITYSANITHTTTGIQATMSVVMSPDQTGVYPTEAKRDSLFQAFLTQIAAMPNVTVNGASKSGSFRTSVTP